MERLDQQAFLKINQDWTNPVLDAVLPYFRDSVFWAPVYLFLLLFITLNWGRKGLWWAIGFLCTIALADMVSSRIFKEGFQRLRPCQDPAFADGVRLLLKNCSPSPSFTSSHAANHFGMATFVSITFYAQWGQRIYLTYLWALFIGYAQVYVGVHYPLDVAGGAAIGTLAGLLSAWVVKSKWGSFTLGPNLNQ